MSSDLLRPGDPAYPPILSKLAASSARFRPPPLYVRGLLPAGPGIAVVGTRHPCEGAVAFTRELAGELVRLGFAIWSGGARGIDAAAHEGAMAAGGATVVCAGSGLDQPYPPEHAELFARALRSGGALLSCCPDASPPQRPWFIRRNELLAASTVATAVIEAGLQSGARNTAAAARRLGRPLLVVPHTPWSAGAGCALELARGARALTGARDVVAALDAEARLGLSSRPATATDPALAGAGASRARPHQPRARGPLPEAPGGHARPAPSAIGLDGEPPDGDVVSPSDAAILSALSAAGDRPVHLDEVCERASLGPATVTPALLTLTWQAVVVEGPAGFFRRVRR